MSDLEEGASSSKAQKMKDVDPSEYWWDDLDKRDTSKLSTRVSLLDMYSMYEEVPTIPQLVADEEEEMRSVKKSFFEKGRTWLLRSRYWILLALIGILTALVSYIMDVFIDFLSSIKWNSYFTQLLFVFLCGSIASACSIIIAPLSRGSGIPELKVILSGAVIPNFLSIRTAIAKIVGFVFAAAGNLFIGKEGPFTHISAIIASSLSKIRILNSLVASPSRKVNILSIAVACGVTATFGAPVGGVLFSIEITSTFFMVHSLWKAFFSSCFCVLTFKAVRAMKDVELYHVEEFPFFSVTPELMLFVLVGIFCGILASAFVNSFTYISTHINQFQKSSWIKPYSFTLSIMVLLTTLGYFYPYLQSDDRHKLVEIFDAESSNDHWTNRKTNLLVFCIVKLLGTFLSICCIVPCGVFTPIFVLGAVLGRLVGICLQSAFSVSNPAAFAMVGAAALSAGITRTISVAVIIFELTGRLDHMLPVLFSVLASYLVSGIYTQSIYDVMSNDLPYLPSIKPSGAYRRTAHEILTETCHLTNRSNPITALDLLLARIISVGSLVPIVSGAKELISTINVSIIDQYLYQFERENEKGGSFDVIKNTLLRKPSRSGRDYSSASWAFMSPTYDSRLRSRESMSSSGDEVKTDTNVAATKPYPVEIPPELCIKIAEASKYYDFRNLEEQVVDIGLLNPDVAPLAILPQTPLSRIHFLFTMLSLNQIFVTESNGRLKGIITKDSFLEQPYRSSSTPFLNIRGVKQKLLMSSVS